MEARIIKTRKQLRQALAEVERLAMGDPRPGAANFAGSAGATLNHPHYQPPAAGVRILAQSGERWRTFVTAK